MIKLILQFIREIPFVQAWIKQEAARMLKAQRLAVHEHHKVYESIIAYMEINGACCYTDIADYMGIPYSTMRPRTNEMEALGMIVKDKTCRPYWVSTLRAA